MHNALIGECRPDRIKLMCATKRHSPKLIAKTRERPNRRVALRANGDSSSIRVQVKRG